MSTQVPYSGSGHVVARRPGPAEARHLDGPTIRTAFLAFLWCAFLLLACAMASRFDERRSTGLPGEDSQAPEVAPLNAPPVIAQGGLTVMAANGATD